MSFDGGGTQSVETAPVIPDRVRRRRLFPAQQPESEVSADLAPSRTLIAYLTALAGGIVTACAWLIPETVASACGSVGSGRRS